MIVVCDTSPVNYLVRIDGIDLLPQLFTTVALPAGELSELQHPRTPPRVASWARQLPRIDERKATVVARDRGLMVTGTLGVLALAAELKLVDLEASIRRLLDTNFRASPA